MFAWQSDPIGFCALMPYTLTSYHVIKSFVRDTDGYTLYRFTTENSHGETLGEFDTVESAMAFAEKSESVS